MVSGRVRSTEGTEGTEGTDGTEGTEYGVGRTRFFVRLLGGMVSITGSMGWSRGCVCVCVSVYQVCVCVCVCVCAVVVAPLLAVPALFAALAASCFWGFLMNSPTAAGLRIC